MLTIDLEVYKAKAKDFESIRQWTQSLALRKKISELEPSNWKNYAAIGDAFLNLENWEQAENAYREALRIEKEFDWAWHNLAVVLGKMNKWEEADTCHKFLSKLKPEFWEVNKHILLVQEHQADYIAWKNEKEQQSLKDINHSTDNSTVISAQNDSVDRSEIAPPKTPISISSYSSEKDSKLLCSIDHVAANCIVGWISRKEVQASYETVVLRVNGSSESYATANLSRKEARAIKSKQRGRCWFRLIVPDKYLNGEVYEAEIWNREKDQSLSSFQYSYQIQGHIDIVENNRIAGWIFDPLADTPLELDLYVNGDKLRSFFADITRNDVKENLNCGFDEFFPPKVHQYQTISITLKNSCLNLLDTPKIFFSNVGAIDALHRVGHAINSGDNGINAIEKEWLLNQFLPKLIQGYRQYRADHKSSVLELQQKQTFTFKKEFKVSPAEVVDVIIPVYKNYEVTKKCIEAAIKAKNTTPYNILVIDDRGPEPVVHEYLEALAKQEQIELIKNSENKGFVHSVNRGMSLHRDRDVVLLNSDAIVNDFWLDRLKQAAYQNSSIASATPLSNHASIFSYPRMCKEVSDLPEDVSSEELNHLFYAANDGEVVRVPAMHGFCCFLKRESLYCVGLFDEVKWGKGYGEEVDWSQRAMSKGWQHVAVPSVFVEHVGSQSFAESKDAAISTALKKLSCEFPEFDALVQDFITRDSLAIHRRRVDVKRLRKAADKYILYISHDFGGGTHRHLLDMSKRLREEGIPVILLAPIPNGQLKLTSPSNIDVFAKYNSRDSFDLKCLIEDLRSVNTCHVHIHSALGFSDSNFAWDLVERLHLPYDITIHDYYFICPRVSLTVPDGTYCGEPSASACDACILKNGVHNKNKDAQQLYNQLGSVEAWRNFFFSKLQAARKVFTPSYDTKIRLERYFSLDNIEVRYHPENRYEEVVLTSQIPAEKLSSRYKIAIIGAISDIKGFSMLKNIAEYASRFDLPLDLIVFGHTKNDRAFEDIDNVRILGKFEGFTELENIAKKNPCDISAFFSKWPETYSYTLSEALMLGLLPLSLNIGAIPERIDGIQFSKLLDLETTSEKIAKALMNAAKNARRSETNFRFPEKHVYFSMLENYYTFQDDAF